MARGETIGTAYVRILADGTGLDKSVEKEMRKSEPALKTAGREHALAYQAGFGDQLEKDQRIQKTIANDIREGFGRITADREVFENLQDEIATHLARGFTAKQGQTKQNAIALGEIIARNVMVGFERGGGLPDFSQSETMRRLIAEATDEIESEIAAVHDLEDAAHRANEAFDSKQMAEQTRKMVTELRAATREIAQQETEYKRLHALGSKMLQDLEDDASKYHRTMQSLHEDTVKFRKENGSSATVLRSLRERLQDAEGLLDRFGDGSRKSRLELERMQRTISQGRLGQGLDRLGNISDRASTKFGRLFGRGNRNNFINFVGGLAEGLGKLVTFPIKAAEAVSKTISGVQGAGKSFTDTFDAAREAGDSFFSSIRQGAEQAGKSFAELAGFGPEAVVGLIAGILAAAPIILQGVSVIVSTISAMVGAAVALISSLAFAAVGALVPLAGLVAPIVAAVAVMGLAFNDLRKANDPVAKSLADTRKGVESAQAAVNKAIPGTKEYTAAVKKLKEAQDAQAIAQKKAAGTTAGAIDQLKTSFKQLSDVAGKAAFAKLPETLTNVNKGFQSLSPLVTAIGGALADVGLDFSKAFASKGFADFINTMTKSLPGQIRTIGSIIKNAFSGIGSFFVVAQPFVDRFLAAVDQVVTDIADRLKTPEGKASLTGFFDKAWSSAVKVKDLLKTIGDLIGTVFFGGDAKAAGDDLITSMTQNIQRFVDFLKSPEGQQAMREWFNQAKDIGKAIGDAVVAVGHFIDALDTPENREIGKLVFELIADSIKLIADVIKVVMPPVLFFFKLFLINLEGIIGVLAKIPGPQQKTFQDMREQITSSINKIDDMQDALDDLTHPHNVIIDTSTVGYKQTVAELADIAWHANHVPKEVTIGVNAKLSANAAKLLNDSGKGQLAAGGIAMGPSRPLIGEAGPEAVVPLARPLSMVDPAVRQLSAFAQGKAIPMEAGGVVGAGKVINVGGLTVVTPTKDPAAVATETVNKLVGAAYF